MDKDGYPDDKELAATKDWDVLESNINGLLDFIEDIWWAPDWGFKRKKKNKFELHTGGWSGNESIIEALQDNLMFWTMCWIKSERGGHYWFEIPSSLQSIREQP